MMGLHLESDFPQNSTDWHDTYPLHAVHRCRDIPEIVRQKCFMFLCKFFQRFLIDFFALYSIKPSSCHSNQHLCILSQLPPLMWFVLLMTTRLQMIRSFVWKKHPYNLNLKVLKVFFFFLITEKTPLYRIASHTRRGWAQVFFFFLMSSSHLGRWLKRPDLSIWLQLISALWIIVCI